MAKRRFAFAVTGSQVLRKRHEAIIDRQLSKLPPADTVIVTGACIGVDAYAARIAYALGFQVHTIVPANLKKVDPEWRSFCHTFEILLRRSERENVYRTRNELLVERGRSGLLAFPMFEKKHQLSRRSGTWMTVRIARRAESRVWIRIMEPSSKASA